MSTPAAPDLSGSAALRWSAGGVPPWLPRVGLTAGWVVAVVAAGGGDGTTCTPADPAACGPDMTFAVSAVLLLATPALLVAMPALGCLAGVAFAATEVARESQPVPLVAFVLHGLACLLVLGWLLAVRRRQAAVAAEVAGPARRSLPPGAPAAGRPWGARSVLAALLVLLGVGALLVYRHERASADGHLAAAARTEARVVARDHVECTVTLLVPGLAEQVRVGVADPAPYEVGRTTPVLVDRSGGAPWVSLVAEPPDPTPWITGWLLAWTLAAVLLGRDLRGGAARRRLRTGTLPAVTVLADRTVDEAVLRPADGGRAFALVPLREPAGGAGEPGPVEDDAEFGRMWRGEVPAGEWWFDEEPEPGRDPEWTTVLGDLREGGWVALDGDSGPALPRGPVRRLRWDLDEDHAFFAAGPDDGDDDPPDPDHDDWGSRPVAAAAGPLPDLPLTLRPPVRRRVLAAVAAAALVAGPLAVALGEPGPVRAVLLLVAGGGIGALGWGRLRAEVRVERSGLVVRTTGRVHRVPWARLHGVRQDGGTLLLAWTPVVVTPVGPFAAPDGDTPEAAAERAAGAMMRLRERALAAGDAGVPPSSRAGGSVAAALLYAAVAVAVALWPLG